MPLARAAAAPCPASCVLHPPRSPGHRDFARGSRDAAPQLCCALASLHPCLTTRFCRSRSLPKCTLCFLLQPVVVETFAQPECRAKSWAAACTQRLPDMHRAALAPQIPVRPWAVLLGQRWSSRFPSFAPICRWQHPGSIRALLQGSSKICHPKSTPSSAEMPHRTCTR